MARRHPVPGDTSFLTLSISFLQIQGLVRRRLNVERTSVENRRQKLLYTLLFCIPLPPGNASINFIPNVGG